MTYNNILNEGDLMPVCPTCGKYVEEGVETCSCGTHFIVSDEEKVNARFQKEEKLVLQYREYESICLEAYKNKEYQKAVEYANMAIDLNLGSDALMKYTKGKALFYLGRYYYCIKIFDEYIKEYLNSFYRFSNISGAYHWKARAQWQLGDGFGSIKSYYKALDYVEKKNGTSEYKNQVRFKIRDERRKVINSSQGVGITNPKLGKMEYEQFDRLEKYREDLDLTMQNLYDAIDEVEGEELTYDSVILKDGELYVIFKDKDSTIEKHFDGTNTFADG